MGVLYYHKKEKEKKKKTPKKPFDQEMGYTCQVFRTFFNNDLKQQMWFNNTSKL